MKQKWITGNEVRNRYGLFQVDLLNAIVDGIETLDERGLPITFENGQVIFQNLDNIKSFGTLEGIIEGVDVFNFDFDQIHERFKDREPQAKPEPLSIIPGKDKQPNITDPGAVAYYNFTKCGLDWIPTGEKACPEKYKQYMAGEIKKGTFVSQVSRLAKRYAKKNNLPLKKGPAPTR